MLNEFNKIKFNCIATKRRYICILFSNIFNSFKLYIRNTNKYLIKPNLIVSEVKDYAYTIFLTFLTVLTSIYEIQYFH